MSPSSAGTVHVVGSLNRDIVVRVDRHPRMGETVAASSLLRLPGGKGLNQAVAAARSGVKVTFVGAVGDDDDGRDLRAALAREGVDVAGVVTVDAPTGTALIAVDPTGENTIVVVGGANLRVGDATARLPRLAPGDVVVAQLEVPVEALAHAMAAAIAAGAVTLLNAAPAAVLPDEVLGAVDVVVVNETEMEMLGGNHALLERLRPAGAVVLTLGRRGARVLTAAGEVSIDGRRVDAVDATGAGDCFVGVLAARLAMGTSLVDAAHTANAAAALSVQRVGAASSMPTAAEIAAAS